MGVVVSSSHVVSAAPCPSGGGLLTLCPCSSVRSLLWETVLHKILQCESFPRAAALHELPQRGSFPWGAVLQEQAAPAWVPHGVTSPARKPAPGWAPLSTGLQVLAGACSQALLQRGAPHGVTASFRHPPAPAWGPFHGLRVDICSTMDLHGLQGDNLHHHGLQHKLQGKTLCSSISSTSSPSSSLTLVSAELLLSIHLTPLSNCRLTAVFSSSSLICYHRGTTTVADWLGLGQRWVRLRTGWHWLYQTWGKLLGASHRSHPYSPPTTKTLPRKPITICHNHFY